MSRIFYLPSIFMMIFMSTVLYAGSIDTLSFSRTQSRAATINATDAAYYNPAGLVKLKDGSYIDLGYQIVTKTISHEIVFSNGAERTPSWFIPNFAYVYKQGRGALFMSLHMPEGAKFSRFTEPIGGIPLLAYAGLNLGPVMMDILRRAGLTLSTGPLELPAVSYLKASEYWLQGRLGGSISINETFALTGGIACSYFDARRSAGLAGAGTVYSSWTSAYGWSGFFGILLTSSDKTALSILYSTPVMARGTERTAKINYSQIMESRLPDYLLIGLHFISFENVSVQISYQITFSGEKTYGTKNIYTSNHEFGYLDWLYVALNSESLSMAPLIAHGNSQNYKFKNGHRIGLGFEFDTGAAVPSVGFSYSTQERYPRAQNPLDPDLGRIGIGGGLKLKASDSLVIETGAATYLFVTDRMLYKSIKMNKTAWTWGLGLTLKL